MADESKTYEHAQVPARTLFEDEPCRCCSCCDGYCPDDELQDRWPVFFKATIATRKYVGTQRIIIALDRLSEMPEDADMRPIPAGSAATLFTFPAGTPALFDGNHVAAMWDRLERAGLTCRVSDVDRLVHLYLGDEHVGWMSHAAPGKGIQRDQLAEVRRVAAAVRRDLTTVEDILRANSTPPAKTTGHVDA